MKDQYGAYEIEGLSEEGTREFKLFITISLFILFLIPK